MLPTCVPGKRCRGPVPLNQESSTKGFKSLAVTLSAILVVSLVACDDQPTEPETQTAEFAKKSPVENNGAPSGPHYNLNIIGTSDKNPEMTGNNGHRIFVPLVGNAKIWLTESTDGFYFEVTDANGTDGSAGFMLPNPDPECTGTTWYSVYYRLLGTPGGSSTIETCYKDQGDIYCASDLDGGVVAVSETRGNGKPVFDNVSRDLLYVDICMNWDETTGECTQVKQTPLFGLDAYEYLWDYNNDGARVAQLRFYEVPTPSGFTSENLVCDET